jgi:hypothetical protein
MHEIVDFRCGNVVPDRFLTHKKINFTHEIIHQNHLKVELYSIFIECIEIVDSEYLVVTYKDKIFFDIFNLSGCLLKRLYVNRELKNH